MPESPMPELFKRIRLVCHVKNGTSLFEGWSRSTKFVKLILGVTVAMYENLLPGGIKDIAMSGIEQN
jgi:hypothetical protein